MPREPLTLLHKRSQGNGDCCSSLALTHKQDEGRFMLLAGDQPPWLQHLVKAIDVTAACNFLADMGHRLRPPRHQHPKQHRQVRADHCRLQHNGGLCLASVSTSLKHDRPQQVKLEELKDSAEQLGEDLRVPVPEANVPGIGDLRSLALKQLLCGTIAGAVASFVVSPFQVLRTRVIAGRGGCSAAEVLGTVAHVEGMQSLMKGSLKITLLATSIQKGIQFAVYEAVQRREQEKLGKDPKWLPGLSKKVQVSTVAGAAAGLASTLVVYPFNSIMDCLLLQPSEYSSLWGSMAKVTKTGGINELYRGIIPALITMVPQAVASFYTYENVKNMLSEQANRQNQKSKDYLGMSAVSIAAGAAAGLVASALTYPLEVARKQISMSILPHGTVGIGGAMTYNNLPQALVGIAQREGIGGFYRGFIIQACQVIPMTAISFAMYEVAKRALVAEHEERRDEVKG
ncbi:hypothetical protein GOP47_0017317 [Adiantum capillus-veneris]|uniref:Uncharacterized protein n=1 Tax=Adiantum capillus-veneris TaxID=13818 RepID=A0A9D4Z9L1_ADICA|nr:hypothetical protein GOP47_0017317 [Adiantum capillus-veneris]